MFSISNPFANMEKSFENTILMIAIGIIIILIIFFIALK